MGASEKLGDLRVEVSAALDRYEKGLGAAERMAKQRIIPLKQVS